MALVVAGLASAAVPAMAAVLTIASIKNKTLKKTGVVVARDQTARATFEFPAHTD
jgi:hypothetical protein